MNSFSKFGWNVSPKNKKAQTIKDSLEIILISSTRKPNLFGTDRGKEFHNSTFQGFLNGSNIKIYSRKISPGAVFAERLNRTVTELLKRHVFERSDGDWIDVLPTITKQYIYRVHSSTELTPIQGPLKKNEGFVHNNLLHKRKKIEPKFQINDLVRTADFQS